ncbi:MAG: hypothetical protein HKM89_04340 [Gemmatimonadales bacterium]|nr:hypothetical protein [Gemmatimonadales bacterium]
MENSYLFCGAAWYLAIRLLAMHSPKTPNIGIKLRAGLVLVAVLGMLGMMPSGASARDVSCGHGAGPASSIHAVVPAVPGAILVDAEECPECPGQSCPSSAVCSPVIASDVPPAMVLAIVPTLYSVPPTLQCGEAISTALPPPTPPPE